MVTVHETPFGSKLSDEDGRWLMKVKRTDANEFCVAEESSFIRVKRGEEHRTGQDGGEKVNATVPHRTRPRWKETGASTEANEGKCELLFELQK